MITKKQIRNLLVVAILMLLLPVFVNHRPLYLEYKGVHFFPAFSGKDVMQQNDIVINLQYMDFKMAEDAFAIMPLIPWSPGRSDLFNSYVGPFDKHYANGAQAELPFHYRHWLGTDGKGADVLAGILYGFRYSVFIALLAILIAGLPGIFLGSVAGFFGNKSILIHKATIPAFIISLMYLICVIQSGVLSFIIAIALFFVLYKILKLLFTKKNHYFPADTIIQATMEVMVSIPALIVIITLAAIVIPGIFSVAVIMGVLLWPDVVRFTRGQVLRIKQEDYIVAATSLGFKNLRIIFHHVLKNGIPPVLILLCFSFGNIILTEATLSFLGAGIPNDVVTWGSLLASGRDNFQAWWLIIFPGTLLMMVVYYLVSFADRYQQFYRNSKV